MTDFIVAGLVALARTVWLGTRLGLAFMAMRRGNEF